MPQQRCEEAWNRKGETLSDFSSVTSALEQRRCLDAKSPAHLVQGRDADLILPSFDVADVVFAQTNKLGEPLLSQSKALAISADLFSDGECDFGLSY